MRGLILSCASRWIGSASSFSSIVTTAAEEFFLPSTPVTLPTVTPATRTGDLAAMLLAFAKTAFSSYGLCQGYWWTNAA